MSRAFLSLKLLGATCIALGLFACSSYDLKVNDNLVYSPAPLFSDYQISDQALKACVQANIREQKITNAKQLQRLSCPAGDIQSLSGLELFLNLSHIGLKGNKISDISALGKMRLLQQLDIRDNQLHNVDNLVGMEKLNSLQLLGNSDLDCGSVEKLKGTIDVTLPEHCQ